VSPPYVTDLLNEERAIRLLRSSSKSVGFAIILQSKWQRNFIDVYSDMEWTSDRDEHNIFPYDVYGVL